MIICIVGPSGSGKTTLAQYLNETLGIPVLISYTTRPMRDNEINGVDHWFVSDNDMPDRNKMLAYTKFGGYHYWVPVESVPSKGQCLYVIDEDGVRYLQENFGNDYCIYTILIKRGIASLIKQVGEGRVMRDLKRKQIPEEQYNLILNNFGTLDDFLKKSTLTIKLSLML